MDDAAGVGVGVGGDGGTDGGGDSGNDGDEIDIEDAPHSDGEMEAGWQTLGADDGVAVPIPTEAESGLRAFGVADSDPLLSPPTTRLLE